MIELPPHDIIGIDPGPIKNDGDNWKAAFPASTWEADDVLLYHADCRDVLPRIPAGAVDAVVTDPPYGIGMRAYDDDIVASRDGVEACPGIRGLCFMTPARVVSFGASLKSWTVARVLWWHKQADIGYPWHGWHMNSEAILVLERDHPAWPKAEINESDLYQTGPESRKPKHPCGKPVALMRRLLAHITTDGKPVIDPFMGSASTCVAAIHVGRRCIGIEREREHFHTAVQRVQKALRDEAGKFPAMRAKPVEQPELPLRPITKAT